MSISLILAILAIILAALSYAPWPTLPPAVMLLAVAFILWANKL